MEDSVSIVSLAIRWRRSVRKWIAAFLSQIAIQNEANADGHVPVREIFGLDRYPHAINQTGVLRLGEYEGLLDLQGRRT